MEKRERINAAFQYLRSIGKVHTQKEFASAVGTSPPNMSAALKGDELYLTDSLLKRINKAYDNIFNEEWLLTGSGDMLVAAGASELPAPSGEAADGVKLVPLIPIVAQAGSLSYFAESVSLRDCELIVSPIKDADYAMRVAGDSMSPEYPNGSQVLIKKINPDMFIDWGRVFVLDTYNGSVMKMLAPGSQPDRVTCISKNPDPVYAPFEVRWEDIIGVYRVLLCMSVK